MATLDWSRPRARLVWLAILSLAGHASCSKSDAGSVAPVPDASTPTPDAAGLPTDATDAATGTDVSVDESLDAEHDGTVEPATDTADGPRDTGTASAGDASDGASDAFDDDSGDAPVDTPSDTEDATADADANPCGVASPANIPRGSAPGPSSQLECTANKPCPPMHECIGGGCDDVWHCIQHVDGPGEHPCSTEPADYCGCDGVTFTAVLVCPNRPYQRVGACEDGVNCDPTMLRCSTPEPPCAEGQVPSVVDGRYGPCVPFHFCRCQFPWECPHREKYRCDTVATRCTTLPVDP